MSHIHGGAGDVFLLLDLKKLVRNSTDHQDGQSIMFVLSFTRGLYVSFYFDNEIAFLALLQKNRYTFLSNHNIHISLCCL